MPSDAEVLRTYIGALTKFLSVAEEASRAGKSVWLEVDLFSRRRDWMKLHPDARNAAAFLHETRQLVANWHEQRGKENPKG
jgi:hypothetical protein